MAGQQKYSLLMDNTAVLVVVICELQLSEMRNYAPKCIRMTSFKEQCHCGWFKQANGQVLLGDTRFVLQLPASLNHVMIGSQTYDHD